MQKELGNRIKELRKSKGLVLKDLSKKTNLSIGFLSLVERGLASAGLASLQNIAEALEVDLGYLLNPSQGSQKKRMVIRSFEHEHFCPENSKYIYFSLAGSIEDKKIDPMMVLFLPGETRDTVAPFIHKGEEFIYVLEGILTFFIEDKEYELYPGDCIHIQSTVPHNWGNFTNRLVKALCVVTPRIL
ncbi:MAG: XRE family transcriptional regulator [Bacillota bacterium]